MSLKIKVLMMEKKWDLWETGMDSTASNKFDSKSEEENLAAILALITLLILLFVYCCWGSSCLRKLLSRMGSCRQEDFEMSRNVRNVDAGQSANSPTIILLPHGRILVVDGTTFSRFHAHGSGLDLFELGNCVLQQERNRMARSGTITELERGTSVKGCRSKAESPLPPTYESLFCDFQQTVPPSYTEVIVDRTFPESSSMREATREENNLQSIV